MLNFLINRFLSAIPVLFIVAVAVFLLVSLTPGDPAQVILSDQATVEQIAALREAMGLDEPIIMRFGQWLLNVLTGDLGYSYYLQAPVTQIIARQIWPTLYLAICAQILAIVLAVPAGILAARRPGSLTDQTVMGASLVGISIPSFLMSLILVLIFAVTMRWLPAAGYAPPDQDFGRFARSLVLPTIALAAQQTALISRMTRSTMLDALSSAYVTTAKAKGLTDTMIVLKHAFRNAAIPVLTVVAQGFGALVAGAVVVETVFNIPGIGQLVANSVLRRDLPMLQGILLLTAVLYVVINFVVDILYGVLDPRARTFGGSAR